MRLYTLTNMYLSSIQKGIQSAHVVHELFTTYYAPTSRQHLTLLEWATKHKTMIVLNGGYAANIQTVFDAINTDDNSYPVACFHEEQEALNGALTCMGIVLPEKVYNTMSLIRNKLINYDDIEFIRTMTVEVEVNQKTLNLLALEGRTDTNIIDTCKQLTDHDITIIKQLINHQLAI